MKNLTGEIKVMYLTDARKHTYCMKQITTYIPVAVPGFGLRIVQNLSEPLIIYLYNIKSSVTWRATKIRNISKLSSK